MPAEEEHRDSAGVDNTRGLHEQVQGGQQKCGGNIGGTGKLKTSRDICSIIENLFGDTGVKNSNRLKIPASTTYRYIYTKKQLYI